MNRKSRSRHQGHTRQSPGDEHAVTMRRFHLAGLLAALTLTASCGPVTANRGTVSDASRTVAPAAQQATQQAPTWGQRYTWKDGLAVELSAPVPCIPGKYSSPPAKDIKRAVKVTVTIINGTGQPFEAGTLGFGSDAQFNGRVAREVLDTDGECGATFESATVLPGKTFTTEAAFSLGPEPGELQIALQPSIGADKAVFVGQA